MPIVSAKSTYTKGPDLRKLGQDKLRRAAEAMLEAAKESIHRGETQGTYTGRLYRSRRGPGFRTPRAAYPRAFHQSERGPMHQASAPGEQPHADTHDLLKHLKVEWIQKGPHSWAVTVGWDGKYAVIARALDHGTASGHIAPRPFRAIAYGHARDAGLFEIKL